jgi:hypothetical protein
VRIVESTHNTAELETVPSLSVDRIPLDRSRPCLSIPSVIRVGIGYVGKTLYYVVPLVVVRGPRRPQIGVTVLVSY